MIDATTSPAAPYRTGGYSTPVWYMISRRERNRLEVLTVSSAGEEMLPIFATKQAARGFLRSGNLEAGWRIRESTAGELISLLLSRLADVGRISVYPRPEGLFDDAVTAEGVSKREFIAFLMGRPLLVPAR